MSMVPMMYRDWWDDFESPFHTSRLLDQSFGSAFSPRSHHAHPHFPHQHRPQEFMSSLIPTHPAHSMLRSGYYRPWRHTDLMRQDSGSTLNIDKDKFQIVLDVQQFTPNEITVKTTDHHVVVEGKHEEKEDEHGYVSRHFVRRYTLPNGADPHSIVSSLSSDGVLTITTPRKTLPPPQNERTVPIQQTGLPAKAAIPSKEPVPTVTDK